MKYYETYLYGFLWGIPTGLKALLSAKHPCRIERFVDRVIWCEWSLEYSGHYENFFHIRRKQHGRTD